MTLFEFSFSYIFLYQLFVSICLIVFLSILVLNLFDVKVLSKKSSLSTPFVSILVPARNEERSIEACVRSLCQQTYPHFEVIILNDNSTDNTGKLLENMQSEFSMLKVISGVALPNDWVGKCWACHQLSKVAHGEWFLFTDADTIHHSDTLRRAMTTIQVVKADMLSIVPFQQLNSFWENVIVPLVHFLIMCFLPMRMIWQSKNTAFSFANGQFILFKRSTYEMIGGHESVKSNIVEDVWLVKKVKQNGGKATIFNGTDAVECRMYHNFREAFRGFSKNLFAGLGYNPFAMVSVCVVMFLCFVLPFIFVSSSLLIENFSLFYFWIPLVQVGLASLMRILISVKFRLNFMYSFLHVLSILMFISIAINSMRWIYLKGGAEWKGRLYNFSNSHSQ